MKTITALFLATALSACATAPNQIDRDNEAWASTIVSCESAAELAGSDLDEAIWSYEKVALLNDRNGGWPSDRARLSNSVEANKQALQLAGDDAISQRLMACQEVVNTYFPSGHPATSKLQ